MAKAALKGFFERIEPVNVYGEKNTRIQKVIFRVPGYTDAFGDKKSEDEYWRLDVMGERIDTFDLIINSANANHSSIGVLMNTTAHLRGSDKC